MLVSIVIPSFNSAATLEECLRSVIAQSFSDREIILIDGGSTDGTAEILRKYAGHFAHCVSEPDEGIYDAANKGWQRARGEWIYFLGADDRLWETSTLHQMSPYLLKALPTCRVVYGKVAMLGRDGEIVKELGSPWIVAREQLRSWMSLPHQGTFHHRSLFSDHGGYDLAYRTGGDYEFLLRELPRRDAVFADGITVAACRTGGQSGKAAAAYANLLLEWRRAQQKHGARLPTARWIAGYAGALLQRGLYLVFGEKVGAKAFDAVRAVFGKKRYWSRTP